MNTKTAEELIEGGEEGGEGLDPKIEAEARAEGWKPKDEYGGDPEKWVDAETFVKRGREINPILRKHNEALRRELDANKAEMEKLRKSVDSLQAYNSKIEERAYNRAIADLKAQKKAAIAAGDNETLAEVEEQLDELRENPPEKAPAVEEKPAGKEGEQKLDPVFVEWMEENKAWFNDKNQDLVDYSDAVARRIRRESPSLVGRAFLDKVYAAVRKTFPDRLGGAREKPGLVEGGDTRGSGSKTSLASLPADARAECKELSSQQWYKDLAKSQNLTPEQMFLRDYE